MKLATQILGDLLGDDDPDYQHFKYLEESVWSYNVYMHVFMCKY